ELLCRDIESTNDEPKISLNTENHPNPENCEYNSYFKPLDHPSVTNGSIVSNEISKKNEAIKETKREGQEVNHDYNSLNWTDFS
ncbi:MAG TPA: hypothetical protein VGP47_03240, partial [Parachlamydiaceae bacterium]|nr:hypothetical protein [Parachlamydiaceae bacterium]